MRKKFAAAGVVAAFVMGLTPPAVAETYSPPIEPSLILPDESNLGQTCTYMPGGTRAEARRVNSQRDIYEFGTTTWRTDCNKTISARVRIYDAITGPVHTDVVKSVGPMNSGWKQAPASHSQTVNYRDSLGVLKPTYHARTIYIQYPVFAGGEEKACVEVEWNVVEGDPSLVMPTFHLACHSFAVAP